MYDPLKKIPIRPVGDRIIIEPDPAEEMTKGGIHIPDNAKEKPQFGTVLRVGDGRGVDNVIMQMLTVLIRGVRWIMLKLGANQAFVDEHVPLNEKPVILYTPGMRVLYGRYAGSEIEYKDVKYLIMRFSDIAAIIEEE